ncbi:sensor histidine kinase [Arthrobacter crystallopoietes]|nr:HAMP domain-containing sensor histidine kinase [Arthrobacter crystallopoietes]
MAATIALTSALTIHFLRNDLVNRLDETLKANAGSMSIALLSPSGAVPLGDYHGLMLLPNGGIAKETPQTSEDVPALQKWTYADVRQQGGEFWYTVESKDPDRPHWRAYVYTLQNQLGTVTIAASYEEVETTVETATALSLLLGLFATAAASIIAWLAITRAFKPLSTVEKTAAAIAAGDLTRRVEVRNPNTEIGKLSSSLNAMLAHIETAFAGRAASEKRMRQFVADASHELRTPLVTIRGFSELYRHGALQTQDDVGAAMGRIESEATRMGQLVEDLLTLARVDEARPLEAKPLDLLLLGNDAAMDARASAPDRDIKVIGLDGAGAQPAPIVGDEGRLRQVVANLMTNALRYTPEGSPIEIAVGVEPVIDDKKDSVIEVRDHGPGISEEEAARVFERFYRADSSRYRETGGTGLGLAIVAALVAQHDGTVRLLDTEGGGATMSIRIPYEPAPDDDRSVFEYN